MYGWRAKIGLITPMSETAEHAFHTHAPAGVTFSSVKIPTDTLGIEKAAYINEHLKTAVEAYRHYDADLIVSGSTSASFLNGSASLNEIDELSRTICGKPGLSAGTAVLEALDALQIKRPAILTPYPDDLNEIVKNFFSGRGFAVSGITGMDMSQFTQNGCSFESASEHFLYQYAAHMELHDADALFISSMELTTMDLIHDLETDLKIPVVTSQSAVFWSALRHCRIGDERADIGRLGFLRGTVIDQSGIDSEER